MEAAPDDPYLRLELASALDHQRKTDQARAQMDEFRRHWKGGDRRAVWRYLRTLGLGVYVDELPPAGVEDGAPLEPISSP